MAVENSITNMTAEEVQAQRERYPRAFSETLLNRIISWGSYIILLSILLYAMNRFGFFSERFDLFRFTLPVTKMTKSLKSKSKK